MLVECPHCLSKVIPMANHICPACTKNMKDLTNVDFNYTTVEIEEGEGLPDICIHCGNVSNDYLSFNSRKTEEKIILVVKLFSLLNSFFGILTNFIKQKQAEPFIKKKLPICSNCKKNYELELEHIDNKNHIITLIVHKNFLYHLENYRKS